MLNENKFNFIQERIYGMSKMSKRLMSWIPVQHLKRNVYFTKRNFLTLSILLNT